MRNQREGVYRRVVWICGVALLGAAAAVHAGAGGKVAVWGAASSYLPTNVPPTLANLVAISGGSSYVLGLNADKTVAAWKGATPDASPTNIPPDLNNVTAIAAGAEHGLVLKSDGTVTAWGNVDMFFPGSPGASFNPTNVPAGVSNVVAIAAGDNHGIALKSDGTVVSWGFYENPGVILQSFPATNVPATLSNVIAIAAGGCQSIALTRLPLFGVGFRRK